MSIAVLCPGPSLPRVWCDDFFCEFDLVVAVNTAGWKFAHHWLCGFDRHVFTPVFERRPGHCLPLLGIRSNKVFAERAKQLGWRGEYARMHYGVGVTPEMAARTGCDRMAFTFPNALDYALSQSGQDVAVFGMDYTLDAACIGGVNGDRSLVRFRKEALWLREIWQPDRIQVSGDASPELLAYVSRQTDTWL